MIPWLPLRLQLYGLAALAFVVVLAGLRWKWVSDALAKVERQELEDRIEAMERKRRAEHEISDLADDDLVRRITRGM